MEKFRREMMSIELLFTCINEEYFDAHFRDYYYYLDFAFAKTEEYGVYRKMYYKLKPLSYISYLGLDKNMYLKLPCFVCASEIY